MVIVFLVCIGIINYPIVHTVFVLFLNFDPSFKSVDGVAYLINCGDFENVC